VRTFHEHQPRNMAVHEARTTSSGEPAGNVQQASARVLVGINPLSPAWFGPQHTIQWGRSISMGRARDLTPIKLGEEWDSVTGATEPGWYAVDDNHVAVMGPFNSKEACQKAIEREIKRER